MCGIVGSVNVGFNNQYLATLNHRGPDDSGTYTYKNVELGHLRLSILDPTASGHQPMVDDNGRFAIVYNGEIYNHLELREELMQGGMVFNSQTDTETLLKGWEYWGKKVLDKLNGIFSFAILDQELEKLYLVRDQFGVKPLYFYQKNNSISFSSELKIFHQLENFDDKLSPEAFLEYISFLWAPGEQTPYEYVKKVLPGHCVEILLQDDLKISETKYYTLPFKGNYLHSTSEKDMISRLDALLRQAVERQLMSDVPLGFFLSGGLDSSLLVAIARHLHPDRQFDCFTIASNMDEKGEGFEDDLPYAKRVAEYLNVNLHVIPANHDIVDQFDHMIWHLDEPQADPAPINVYNISKGARELGIKVLLGGAAGDDLFSGYRRHQALKYDKFIENVPLFIRKFFKDNIKKISSEKALGRRLKKISKDWDKPLDERMLGYFNWLPDEKIVYELLNKKILEDGETKSPYSYFNNLLDEENKRLNWLDKLLFLELKTFLVDHNLNYTDKMSMAAGVEARVPYLDKDVVEFAGKIPEHLKIKKGETKYILKKVAERYLPKEIIYRKKTGFGAPIRQWLKDDLKPIINEQLGEDKLREQGIFNPETIHKIIEMNDMGEEDFSYTIWSLLAIQSWLRQFKWSL